MGEGRSPCRALTALFHTSVACSSYIEVPIFDILLSNLLHAPSAISSSFEKAQRPSVATITWLRLCNKSGGLSSILRLLPHSPILSYAPMPTREQAAPSGSCPSRLLCCGSPQCERRQPVGPTRALTVYSLRSPIFSPHRPRSCTITDFVYFLL